MTFEEQFLALPSESKDEIADYFYDLAAGREPQPSAAIRPYCERILRHAYKRETGNGKRE